MEIHLALALDYDDWNRGGGPAVLRRERLVTVPQNNDLTQAHGENIRCCESSLYLDHFYYSVLFISYTLLLKSLGLVSFFNAFERSQKYIKNGNTAKYNNITV